MDVDFQVAEPDGLHLPGVHPGPEQLGVDPVGGEELFSAELTGPQKHCCAYANFR